MFRVRFYKQESNGSGTWASPQNRHGEQKCMTARYCALR